MNLALSGTLMDLTLLGLLSDSVTNTNESIISAYQLKLELATTVPSVSTAQVINQLITLQNQVKGQKVKAPIPLLQTLFPSLAPCFLSIVLYCI